LSDWLGGNMEVQKDSTQREHLLFQLVVLLHPHCIHEYTLTSIFFWYSLTDWRARKKLGSLPAKTPTHSFDHLVPILSTSAGNANSAMSCSHPVQILSWRNVTLAEESFENRLFPFFGITNSIHTTTMMAGTGKMLIMNILIRVTDYVTFEEYM
jgi:hypothetical protein